jgi:hypothetical protein
MIECADCSNNSFLPQKDFGGILRLPSLFLLVNHIGMIDPTGDYRYSEIIAFFLSIVDSVLKSTSYADNIC